MSFFGFENNNLEREKKRFLEGSLQENEDIAVYNWGQDDYGGLGDALLEGGDENNDETFGGTGPVGKDFDFTAQTLPQTEKSSPVEELSRLSTESSFNNQTSHRPSKSRDAIWDSKSSPFSVLPRIASTSGRSSDYTPQTLPTNAAPGSSKFSPFDDVDVPQAAKDTQKSMSSGVYTLQEIEADMRAKSQQNRVLQAQAQAPIPHVKPPRMQTQSPSSAPQVSDFYPNGGPTDQQILEQLTDAERSEMKMWELEQKFGGSSEQIRERLAFEEMERRALRPDGPSSFDVFDRQSAIDRMILKKRYQMEVEREQREALLLEEQKRHYVEHALLQEQQRQLELRNAYIQQQQNQHQRQIYQLQSHVASQNHSIGHPPTELQSLQQQQILRPRSQVSQHRHDDSGSRLQNTLLQQQVQRQHTPVYSSSTQPSQQEIRHLQLQQRILAQLAQAEFTQTMNGGPALDQGVLRAEATRKILEAERLEEKRRRKAEKIAYMSRYNDLMTQSDKDFITRIQVSQLVTSDPYSDDFYAQVYGSLLRSRMGINQDERVLKFGSGEGVGLGLNQRGAGRRQNAMQRMEAQVERIVNNARQREKEKSMHAIHSLQGALGKTAGRSYKAAPRQMLQVDGAKDVASPNLSPAQAQMNGENGDSFAAGAAKEAARRGREALENAQVHDGIRRAPLTKRETLITLENLYDIMLEAEQMRRQQPSTEDEGMILEWNARYSSLVQRLYDGLSMSVPLEACNPHPFISLLTPSKGKKFFTRMNRHLNGTQQLTVLTLLVACFQQLDVVVKAPLLDEVEDSPEKLEVDKQSHLFLVHVIPTAINVINSGGTRVTAGLLGLFMEHCDAPLVARTVPGVALLSSFLLHVASLKESSVSSAAGSSDVLTEEDMMQWEHVYNALFNTLRPHLLLLFPSSRMSIPPNDDELVSSTDLLDRPVWQLLAALVLHASHPQQQILVTTLREKILDNVVKARGAKAEKERDDKLINVDLFLHAVGLDSNQINFK